MHAEYEKKLDEQNHLLAELIALDEDGENFESEFDRVVRKLVTNTKELDQIVQSEPSVRRALAL